MPRFCGSIRDVRVALVGRGPRGSVASARLGARRFGPGLRVLAHETSCARAVTCLGQGGEGCPLWERPQPAPLQGGVCSEQQGEARVPAYGQESSRRGYPAPTARDNPRIARCTRLARETLQFRPPINSAPKMRNHDRPTDNETDRERLEDLGTRDALLGTASEMIRHAVITPQHQGCDEAEQLQRSIAPGSDGAH